MIQRESIFVDGVVVGIIRKDDYTGLIAFSPTHPPCKLPALEWASVDELKQAVLIAYKKESLPD